MALSRPASTGTMICTPFPLHDIWFPLQVYIGLRVFIRSKVLWPLFWNLHLLPRVQISKQNMHRTLEPIDNWNDKNKKISAPCHPIDNLTPGYDGKFWPFSLSDFKFITYIPEWLCCRKCINGSEIYQTGKPASFFATSNSGGGDYLTVHAGQRIHAFNPFMIWNNDRDRWLFDDGVKVQASGSKTSLNWASNFIVALRQEEIFKI